LCVKFDEIQVP